MKVLLIFPPQWIPYRPYLSLPSLTAYLRENGIDVEQKDLNIESYDAIFSKDYLLKLEGILQKRFNLLDSAPKLDAGLDQKYYHDLFIAISSLKMIAQKLDAAKQTLRDGADFYDAQRVEEARAVLQQALNVVSIAYHPTRLDLESFETPSFRGSLRELQAITINEEENPFISLFRERALPFIKDGHFDLVGISVTGTSQLIPAMTLSRMLKASENPPHVAVGGNMITQLADGIAKNEQLFRQFIDSAIIFEGEGPLLSLIQNLGQGQSLANVPNLIYLSSHGVCVNGTLAPVNINALPTPDFDGIPLRTYFSPQLVLPVLSSRGCYWGKCAFCTQNLIYEDCYHLRDPSKVTQDILKLSGKYQTKYFSFVDEAISPNALNRLADEFINENLGVCCSTNIRLERQFTPELCNKAFTAGFKLVYPGLESGCDRVLTSMNKGINKETAGIVCRNLSAAGIWDHLYVMVGFPGETRKEAQETISFLQANKNAIRSFHVQNFSLGKGMIASRLPENYGLSFEKIQDRPFEITFKFKVASGLNFDQAHNLVNFIMNKIAFDWEGQKTLYRLGHHYLLLYLDRYGDPSSVLVATSNRPKPERVLSVPQSPWPQVNEWVRTAKLNFNLVAVQRNISSNSQTVEYRSPFFLIFNAETGHLCQIPEEAMEILKFCDGRTSLESIARRLSLRYEAPLEDIKHDISLLINSMFSKGYIS